MGAGDPVVGLTPRLFGWVTSLLIALGIAFLVYSSRDSDRHAGIESPVYPGDASLVTGSLPASSKMSGYIQVGYFANLSNVERTRTLLATIGRVEVSTVNRGSGSLYRVRIGPLTNADQAQGVLQQVIEAGYADAHLIESENTRQ